MKAFAEIVSRIFIVIIFACLFCAGVYFYEAIQTILVIAYCTFVVGVTAYVMVKFITTGDLDTVLFTRSFRF